MIFLKIRILVLFTFFLLFLVSCSSEYSDHYFSEHVQIQSESWSRKDLSYDPSFSSWELLVLPDTKVRDQLIGFIDSAQKQVWIEIYTWTDTNLLESVIKAKKRNVDIRVILEGNVYGIPTINKKIFTALQNEDIPVVYADNYRYTFTHAKFFLIDGRYFISTGNWTASFFTKNRDAIFTDTNKKIRAFLEQLFLADFEHRAFLDTSSIPNGLIISSMNAREQIETIIRSTKKDVIFYIQTLHDSKLMNTIEKLHSNGISVKVCVADNEENRKTSLGLPYPITLARKPYLHGKFVLIDSQNVFIGSQNFTANAIDNNREVGIFLEKNLKVYTTIFTLFQKDCIFQ